MPTASSVIVLTSGLLDVLDSIVNGSGSPYYDAQVALVSNQVFPGYGTVLADYTECTFSGYSRQTVGSWGSASAYGDGVNVVLLNNTVSMFTYTGSAGNSGNIFGAILLTSAGALISGDVPFASGVVLGPGQSFFYQPGLLLNSPI